MVNDASFMAHEMWLMTKKGVWNCGRVSPMANVQAKGGPPFLVMSHAPIRFFEGDLRQHVLTIA